MVGEGLPTFFTNALSGLNAKELKMKALIIGAALVTFAVSPGFSKSLKSNNSQIAICNGQVVGQDPDQNIVFALTRECGLQGD